MNKVLFDNFPLNAIAINYCSFLLIKIDIYGQTNGSSSASMPPQTILQPPVAPPPLAPPPPFNAGKFINLLIY